MATVRNVILTLFLCGLIPAYSLETLSPVHFYLSGRSPAWSPFLFEEIYSSIPDGHFKTVGEKVIWFYKFRTLVEEYFTYIDRLTLRLSDDHPLEIQLMNQKTFLVPITSRPYFEPSRPTVTYSYSYSRTGQSVYRRGVGFFTRADYRFYDSIYGGNAKAIQENLQTVNIFGRALPFNRNNRAAGQLDQCVRKILKEAETDPEISGWIKNIRYVYTYKNRMVAGENRPSMHSYGLAVDFIPKNDKRNIYWLWSMEWQSDWWNIEDNNKVQIPEKIVNMFEDHGFCWGGRWYRFDQMHFEYRPEIALNPLNR